MTTKNRPEVETYRRQARRFLERSREYVASGDLHQASEKGWGAAAHMAKAVAAAHDWRYDKHSDFIIVMNNVRRLTGNERVRMLRGIATDLHSQFYERDEFLNANDIAADVESVGELLDILEPLTT